MKMQMKQEEKKPSQNTQERAILLAGLCVILYAAPLIVAHGPDDYSVLDTLSASVFASIMSSSVCVIVKRRD